MTQNAELMQTFLAAKEQIFISGSVLDEEVAYQYLLNQPAHLARIKADIAASSPSSATGSLKNRSWSGRAAGRGRHFPRIKLDLPIDLDQFYAALNGKYKTMVGPVIGSNTTAATCASALAGPTMRSSTGLEISRTPCATCSKII